MTDVKKLSETLLSAWALGANINVPSPEVRLHWMPFLADLSKMVIRGEITIDEVTDYTRELLRQPGLRSQPQLWSLKFVRDHILVWVQTREGGKSLAPPAGFVSGIDHLGRIHSWDWKAGVEVIMDKPPEPDMGLLLSHGAEYVPMGPNERVVKRQGREGYQRDLFLMGDTDLTEEEQRQLMEIADGS